MRERLARLTRGLRRRPGYSLAIIGSLALALGLNSAVFAVVESVLLRPLPYPDEQRLVTIGVKVERSGEAASDLWSLHSMVTSGWDQSRTLESVATVAAMEQTIRGRAAPEYAWGARASIQLARAAGFRMALGRWFTEAEVAARVVVISDALWARQYARDSAVVGATLSIVGEPWTVIGILARGQELPREVEFWTPTGFGDGQVIARIHMDVALAAVGQELAAASRGLYNMNQGGNTATVLVKPLRNYLFGPTRPALRLLLAAAGLLLVLGVANVASLSLGRALHRRREFAIRLSLGASKRSLVQLLIAEHAVLAVGGLVLGLLLSRWGAGLLEAFGPAEIISGQHILIGQWTILGAGVVALAAAALVGVVPVAVMRHDEVAGALTGAYSVRGRTETYRARRLLVSAQLAIAVLLICGSGLLIRTVAELTRGDRVGFAPAGVVIASIPMFGETFRNDPSRRNLVLNALRERVRAFPGVTSIGVGPAPLVGGRDEGLREGFSAIILHKERGSDEGTQTIWVKQIDHDYLKTYRIPLLRGRDLTSADDSLSPPVVLLNASAARLFFRDGDALAREVTIFDRLRDFVGGRPRVVGIVGDVLQRDLTIDANPEVYVPLAQQRLLMATVTVGVRTTLPTSTLNGLRQALVEIDPTLAASRLQTMDDLIDASLERHHFLLLLLGLFGALAFVIAAVGLYAIVAYFVTERTREFGIRIALGAQRRHLYGLVFGEGLRLVALGIVAGLLAALALGSFLQSFLFGVGARDPITLAAAAVVLLTVALLAMYLPARSAADLQPVAALRAE